jgi:hypothetical protein
MSTSTCSARTRGRLLTGVALAFLVLLRATPGAAQQRPLLTQDPEAIGAGNILIEGGIEYGTDIFFPASGLTGNLLRVPQFGIVVGVSSIAEIQLSGGPYQRLLITSRQPAPLSGVLDAPGDTTTSVDDIFIGAKLRLVPETDAHPAVAFRFATKLPDSKQPSGLGLNTIDFYAGLAFGKTMQSVRFVGNLGVGILPDPVTGQRQNDVLTYGASVARAVSGTVDVVGEINGRASLRANDPPVGTESRAVLRAGLRYTQGPARLDAAVLVGMTPRDPGLGVTAGFTYVFKAFTVK